MKYWQVYWKLFIKLFISVPFQKYILENSGATTQHMRKMRPRIQLILGQAVQDQVSLKGPRKLSLTSNSAFTEDRFKLLLSLKT